jgi:NADH-quinone oxidoreductase subunit J|tara:strand:- start:1774 stop:2406 length:633 start_codon:yes stop_codon:yes gene_type:complete
MVFTDFIFYVLATILLLSATQVITAKNPVQAALFLVLSFFTASGIWLLLQAEFLAIVLVLVYVGAVMVLFLFVVMMLDINIDKLREGFWSYLPLAGLIGVLMAVEMVMILSNKYFIAAQSVSHPVGYSDTAALGHVMYTEYLLPFELAAIVLLVAIVAAIALTLREKRESKSINPSEQVIVRKEDRLRMVNMKSETEPKPDESNTKGEAS